MDLIQYIETRDIKMKHLCLHHIHIKYKGEYYTVSHDTDVLPLDSLEKMIIDIKKDSNKGVKHGVTFKTI